MRTPPAVLCVILAACTGPSGDGPSDDDTDDTDLHVVSPCAWATDPVAEFARDVSGGMAPDGTLIEYGNPPQGGAPYAPFEVRMHASYDTSTRIEVSATAVDHELGTELGSIAQPQVFLCANAGPHAGWLYGGEVHVRFWEQALEALEGRVVDITLSVALPGGVEPVTAHTSGALTWTLGRTTAADGGP